MRMSMPRFTRPTNAFSKKIDNHVDTPSLCFAHDDFIRMHTSPRPSPALAAGAPTGRVVG